MRCCGGVLRWGAHIRGGRNPRGRCEDGVLRWRTQQGAIRRGEGGERRWKVEAGAGRRGCVHGGVGPDYSSSG